MSLKSLKILFFFKARNGVLKISFVTLYHYDLYEKLTHRPDQQFLLKTSEKPEYNNQVGTVAELVYGDPPADILRNKTKHRKPPQIAKPDSNRTKRKTDFRKKIGAT